MKDTPGQKWATTDLGDVIDIVMGQAPAGKDCNKTGEGTPFVKTGEFGELRPVIREWTTDPKRLGKATDVFISVVGATCGKINLGADCAIGRSVAALRPKPERLDQFFLHYFMEGQVERLRGGSLGAAQTVISKEMLARTSIPLPPLEVQQRIVAVLDDAFEGLARARAHAEANLQNARELFTANVDELLSSVGDDWSVGPLSKLVGPVATGPFGSLLHKSDYVENETPLVNPANIIDGKIAPDMRKTVNKSALERLSSYILAAGDIVIGRRGEMGRCAVVEDDQAGWLCGTGSFFIRPKSDVVPWFVAHVLRSPSYVAKLEAASTGATMANLSNRVLGELELALPSRQEQREYLDLIDGFAQAASQLENSFVTKLQDLDDLRQSILQKAFAGELT